MSHRAHLQLVHAQLQNLCVRLCTRLRAARPVHAGLSRRCRLACWLGQRRRHLEAWCLLLLAQPYKAQGSVMADKQLLRTRGALRHVHAHLGWISTAERLAAGSADCLAAHDALTEAANQGMRCRLVLTPVLRGLCDLPSCCSWCTGCGAMHTAQSHDHQHLQMRERQQAWSWCR